MSTKVFLANISSFGDPALFDSFFKLMPEDRKKKTLEKKYDKDRFLSLGVGALLELAKTFQAGETYRFNLSHSGTMAMCIVSDKECGCDVELKREGTLGIADRFFYGKEKEIINAQATEEDKIDMFFRLWTLKESFMKATRLGFRLPLDEFCVVPTCDGSTKSSACGGEAMPSIDAEKFLSHKVNDSAYSFFEYDCIDGYACSICLREYNGEKPALEIVDFREALKQIEG